MRPQRLRLSAVLFQLTLVTAAAPAFAAWPHDIHNGNVPLSTFASFQVYPRMYPDGAGGAFIAWHESRGNYEIYAQRISTSGVTAWGAAGVAVCTAAGDQANTALTTDGAGGVIIAWHDARGGGAFDIYAQRLNAAGVPQWTANGVAICTAAGEQINPQLASDGAGGAIITWPDARGGSRDIYAQRVNAAGVPQWSANGLNICSATGDQDQPVIQSDGAGGAIIAWADLRSSFGDIYVQRLNANGTALYLANGLGICTAVGGQSEPQIVADATGGSIICWRDERTGTSYDVYAQRLTVNGAALWNSNGSVVADGGDDQYAPVMTSDGAGGAVIVFQTGVFSDLHAQRISSGGMPMWPVNGVPISAATGFQELQCIVPDGSGGAIIGWSDNGTGFGDIYAQRVTGQGVVKWAPNGRPVAIANNSQVFPSMVADGAGGAILAWHDQRLGAGTSRTYAQRIDRFGELGNPEGTITSVRDTPNDQGGQVKVSWSASYLDVDPTYGIAEYRLWRSVPPGAVAAAALAATRVTSDPDEAAASGKWLVLPNAATDYAWELVGSQPAAILPNYSLVTATIGDSVAGSNPRTAFMVEALSGALLTSPRWFSAPDSGYSVDNLPPATPAPFTGVFTAGSNDLDWGANAEPDLAGYRLYRGVTADFVADNATLISSQTGVGYEDVTDRAFFYKLSAVDAHGNESALAFLAAQGTVDAGDADRPVALRLGTPEPNPARAAARIEFDLPRETFVSLAVYDASGRRVRSLIRGTHEAGRASTRWDLRNDDGQPVPGGLYFVRLEAGGRTLTRRMIAMR